MWLAKLKYFLYDALQKTFADPWTRGWTAAFTEARYS